MNKKGFTLVELLAVIAILAILVIIALPNVMGMFNTAKENSFRTEVKEVFKTAQQEWIQDSMYETDDKVYSRCKTGCTNSLDLSGRSELEYYIKFNKAGEVVEYYATDGTFQYGYNDISTPLKIDSINTIQKIAELTNPSDIINISSTGVSGGNGSKEIYTQNFPSHYELSDVISEGDYVNSYQNFTNSERHSFLKHKIDADNKIVETVVGFVYNNQVYYLKGSMDNYESNKTILANAFGIKSNVNEGNGCWDYTTNFSCESFAGDIEVELKGTGSLAGRVEAKNRHEGTSCFVYADGRSGCDFGK